MSRHRFWPPGDTACGSGGDCGLPQRRSGPADYYGAYLPPGKPHTRQPAGDEDADDHSFENL
ncbi:hypothetical protein NY756_13325 [Escherichia coli]|nr:hypothetical protein [Escherichia coli]MCE3613153.1 hypothetical protein [Escherichia coli]MCQ6600153.1 hypothetical protein [Escherichia coli]MDA4163798.1 hypothetical protein [Escherichia coli]MDA4331886.1 hypothetical protein [Escherichia coli]